MVEPETIDCSGFTRAEVIELITALLAARRLLREEGFDLVITREPSRHSNLNKQKYGFHK